jgi:GMP synthase (glutamine-hydrolysing)
MLIVKTGTALTALTDPDGDFEDWISRGLGQPVHVCSVFEGEELPPPRETGGVVVTGSASMVSDGDGWAEQTAEWLLEAVDAAVPVLGICYGHQLLAHALGGHAGPNPRGREIGTVVLDLADAATTDPLFGGLSSPIDVQATHLESVLELPPGARPLASSPMDPHHAFRMPNRPVWGVQFHPEFSADVSRAYIDAKRHDILAEGLDADRLLADVRDTPVGTEILARFARIAAGRAS